MLHLFLTAFSVVLIAEIVGDKLIYTTAVLTIRYRPAPMMAGLFAGFVVKMGAAVAWGRVITLLPRSLLMASTMGTFIVMMLRVRQNSAGDHSPERTGGPEAWSVAFASVVGGEWADVGQLTAATLVVQCQAPILIWSAAVAAMTMKGCLALTLGSDIRRYLSRVLSPALLQYLAILVLLGSELFTVAEVLRR